MTPDFTSYNALHNYIAVINSDGQVLYTNPTFQQVLGKLTSVFDMIQDQRLSESLKVHIQTTGKDEYMFNALVRGSVYYFHVTRLGQLFVCNGQSENDIDRMYQLQVSSRKKMLDIKSMLLGICMLDKTDFEAALEVILKSAADILGCERVSYWLVNEEASSIECRKLYLLSQKGFQPCEGMLLNREGAQEYFDYINKEYAFILAENTAIHPATKGFEETYSKPNQIRSLLDVPVWHNGRLYAIICCEQVAVEKRWLLEEAQFMLSLSDSVALCLQTRDRILTEAKLTETNLKLQRSNSDLENFAVVAAHDIKSPLRSIVNFLGLLKKNNQGALDQASLEYIDYSMRNATQLTSLINDLLAYSKVEQHALTEEQVDLNNLFQDIAKDQQHYIDSRQGQIEVKKSMPVLRAPRNLLYQMFSNIIHNAIKYSHTAKPPHLEIDVENSSDFYHLSFSDNGIGVDDQYAEKIFSLFGRAHSLEEFDGTGIGLATCRKIAELLNGRITYQRRKDPEGSIFTVSLPK